MNNDNYLAELCLAKRHIKSIDFTNIINKLINYSGWSKGHALELCDMYRNFLFIQKKYGKEHNLPPSNDIDDFWHMHILDTKSYRRDCQAVFGRYLDHYPYLGIDSTSDRPGVESAFAKVRKFYALEFDGREIYQIRGKFAKIISFLRSFLMQSRLFYRLIKR